jgi:1-acyl-sn-glycerol-3-phosphate acyltransferase
MDTLVRYGQVDTPEAAMPLTPAGSDSPARHPVGAMRYSRLGIVLRSTLFNVLFYLNVVVLMILGLPLLLGSHRAVLWLERVWARSSLWLLEAICGTRVEFRGLENIPHGGVLIAAKHQSFLETFALTLHVRDFSYVLKRELMWIPFFGWYLARGGQTGIDRGNARVALLQSVNVARAIFAEGRALFIFPEGTRRPVDAPPAYKNGVGFIYEKTGVSCLPVALNTGLFWPRRRFLRLPGHCVIEFLPAIAPGLDRNELLATLQARVETRTAALVATAREENPWLADFAAAPQTAA